MKLGFLGAAKEVTGSCFREEAAPGDRRAARGARRAAKSATAQPVGDALHTLQDTHETLAGHAPSTAIANSHCAWA